MFIRPADINDSDEPMGGRPSPHLQPLLWPQSLYTSMGNLHSEWIQDRYTSGDPGGGGEEVGMAVLLQNSVTPPQKKTLSWRLIYV